MKFNALLGLGVMAIIAVLLVQPVWAAKGPEDVVSPSASVRPVPITDLPIMPGPVAQEAQDEVQVARRRRRRGARNIIGGAAAGALIGGVIGGERGARAGAVIGGISGAARASKRPRYRKWRRGGSRRWRNRRRR